MELKGIYRAGTASRTAMAPFFSLALPWGLHPTPGAALPNAWAPPAAVGGRENGEIPFPLVLASSLGPSCPPPAPAAAAAAASSAPKPPALACERGTGDTPEQPRSDTGPGRCQRRSHRSKWHELQGQGRSARAAGKGTDPNLGAYFHAINLHVNEIKPKAIAECQ